jgi:AraC-like DNA-binding protein
MLSEGGSRLQEVRFPHQPFESEASYEARFPAPVTFQAERAALVIPAADLNLPLSEHNAELHELALSHLAKQLPRPEMPLQVQVRRAIEALLGTGSSSYRQVASALYMHPRTLQRRLREEGTTFEAIKDDVRRDLAQRYLSQPEVPLTQVTALLDYSEQSALGRSCQRWFHDTPGRVRDHLAAGSALAAMA